MKNNLLSEKLIYTGDSLTPTHLHLCTYNATEMQESSGDTFQSVKETLDNERINWLQVHGLKDTETIREICSHFEIDFLVLQDILNADHPTKIEEHDKYIVLILKIFYPNEHKRMMTSTDCSNNKSASFWEITMYLPFLKKKQISLMKSTPH